MCTSHEGQQGAAASLPSVHLFPVCLPDCGAQVMRSVRQRSLPMVVDADGLWLVNQDVSLVAGRPAPVPLPRCNNCPALALDAAAESSSHPLHTAQATLTLC